MGSPARCACYVNDVEWHEADSLVGAGPERSRFITRTEDDGRPLAVFGDGVRGARLPTGVENVKAVYRNGIGKGGNVKAGQISLLMSRPLGVKDGDQSVAALRRRRPRDARPGAEERAARRAGPRSAGLDGDYADFARTFAGIGKASGARSPEAASRSSILTIAGADDIPIAESSDLYRNLLTALRQFGDPYLGIRVDAARAAVARARGAPARSHPTTSGKTWSSAPGRHSSTRSASTDASSAPASPSATSSR